MLPITPDLIERTAAVIGTDGITDEEIETKVLALSQDPMLARRLIDWLPEAFAIAFVPHFAKVILPKTFSAKSSKGKWIKFDFHVEPIFPIAINLGMEMYHAGSSNAFSNIVQRSSILNAINSALNAGETLDGATLSGPALIGIPAETYLPKQESLWHRLFR